MPYTIGWGDIALRLFLTLLAGAALGYDRGVRGHATGLRTTILVCLAASVAMIQMNMLLPVSGKTPNSFAVMDLMRLPLGILTGVGFIGGGTILRRGDIVTGVTTAATLWMVTVIGLCLGGGEIWLGLVSTALSVLTLWLLKFVDVRIPREQKAQVAIKNDGDSLSFVDLESLISSRGYSASFRKQERIEDNSATTLWFDISWRRPETSGPPVDLMEIINRNYTVQSFTLVSEIQH